MRFFVSHSYEVIRLFLNQIAMSVFGLILFGAALGLSDNRSGVWTVLASVFAVAFYLYILFATVRDLGAKDNVKVESGREKYDSLKGIKLGLWAQVPNLLLVLLLWVGILISVCGAERVGDSVFALSYIAVHSFLQAVYIGIVDVILPDVLSNRGEMALAALVMLITSIPAIVACWLGYLAGVGGRESAVPSNAPRQDEEA